MAGGPPKKKKNKEEQKTTEQQAFQSAANSQSNIFMPMLNAEYIRIRHPFSSNDIHTSTSSDKFFQTFKDFSDKGLFDKMCRELTIFGETIDPRWLHVLNEAQKHCEESNGVLPEANQSA